MTENLANTFQFQALNGKLSIGSEYNRARFSERLKKGGRGHIIFDLPESRRMRRFFEGAIVPLCTYFQDNLDYRSNEDCELMRESLIEDCLGCTVKIINGKERRKRKSSKGRDNLKKLSEYAIDYLVENYDLDQELCLDPDKYKTWRDTIFPFGGPDNYIDYLISIKSLKQKI
jgi:hypothetical protein